MLKVLHNAPHSIEMSQNFAMARFRIYGLIGHRSTIVGSAAILQFAQQLKQEVKESVS